MYEKKILIITLLIAIIAMSVGYAALAQVLNINGTANITALWNVEITNIELKDSIGAKNKKIPTYDERTASFDVDLSYPGASATYIVKVENKGTVDAKLSSISGVEDANSEEPAAVYYTVTPISETDGLKAGDETTFDVKFEWQSITMDSIPLITSKAATINLNYIQK